MIKGWIEAPTQPGAPICVFNHLHLNKTILTAFIRNPGHLKATWFMNSFHRDTKTVSTENTNLCDNKNVKLQQRGIAHTKAPCTHRDPGSANRKLVLVQDVSRFLITHTAANSPTARATTHLTYSPLTAAEKWTYMSGESLRALSVNWLRCVWKGNEKRLAPRLLKPKHTTDYDPKSP